MINLENSLKIDRCPHCSVANPNIGLIHHFETRDTNSRNQRFWKIYKCSGCGGVITGAHRQNSSAALQVFPEIKNIDGSIPDRARDYLNQAVGSLNAPAGSIMLSASSVDAMLKNKGYSSGSLYSRINQASDDHLITSEMAQWAHQVRLDANDQRHSDQEVELPTSEDAQKTIDFALALAEYLFVLPSKINRGIEDSGSGSE